MLAPLAQPSANDSDNSAANTTPRSLLLFKLPTLGDKLHRIARVSPSHLLAVELLVDQIIARIDGKNLVPGG